MKTHLRSLAAAVALLTGAWLHAAEHIPAAPAKYFNDYAGIVSGPTAAALNTQLENYERESSNQLLVAIFPKMESDSSVEDYTVRVAQAWKAGQQGKNNGAVLFAFMQEHQLYIQVGYGLEATLTDAAAHRIVENVLKPRFRAGDFDAGLREAVAAMIAATKGEYKGTGRTRAEGYQSDTARGGIVLVVALGFIALMVFFFVREGLRRPHVFGSPLRRRNSAGNTWWNIGGPGNFGGGGGWSGGGGGGGFSGGGGSFGGGGAGGKW